MNTCHIDILFTDLDGTLLSSKRTVSPANLSCLHHLGRQGTVRVIATGRSLYSFQQVIPRDFPADFLIFSSGSGILDLRSYQMLRTTSLSPADVPAVTERLDQHRADFMVHHEIPENHCFTYKRHSSENHDFNRRIEIYRQFAIDFGDTGHFPRPAAQIIAILPAGEKPFNRIRDDLPSYQVTRTTSPLDHTSTWLEITPKNVHKGSAAAWLCNHLDIDPARSMAVGNDYNDVDLLNFTPQSYILKNAPKELHDQYSLCRSHDQDGFSHAINSSSQLS